MKWSIPGSERNIDSLDSSRKDADSVAVRVNRLVFDRVGVISRRIEQFATSLRIEILTSTMNLDEGLDYGW